jgi:biopolymer transport protein ExbB/TolQ
MWIIQIFIEGGYWFMMTLLVIQLVIVYFIVRKIIDFFIKIPTDKTKLKKGLPEILQTATFALFAGILFQVIGLYQALEAIEQMGTIPTSMLAGGLKVSTITTLYGAYIFGVSSIIWFFLNQRYLRLIKNLGGF